MDSTNLIRMANRIGEFFEAMPDRGAALEDIAAHLKKFWDPRMRQALLKLVDGNDPEITDIVLLAVQRHRSALG